MLERGSEMELSFDHMREGGARTQKTEVRSEKSESGGLFRLFYGNGVHDSTFLLLGAGRRDVLRLMNSTLFNAGGVDVAAYVTVVPLMMLVTMLAAYLPARRAARIAPMQALRYE